MGEQKFLIVVVFLYFELFYFFEFRITYVIELLNSGAFFCFVSRSHESMPSYLAKQMEYDKNIQFELKYSSFSKRKINSSNLFLLKNKEKSLKNLQNFMEC